MSIDIARIMSHPTDGMNGQPLWVTSFCGRKNHDEDRRRIQITIGNDYIILDQRRAELLVEAIREVFDTV